MINIRGAVFVSELPGGRTSRLSREREKKADTEREKGRERNGVCEREADREVETAAEREAGR